MINIKYIYIIFLIIIFFIYGLTLSEIIDFIFPTYNKSKYDYHTAIEMIGEIGIAYIIYFSLKYYLDTLILSLFNKISNKIPSYLNQVLLLAFSFGIFKHLKKSNDKIIHFQKKMLKPFTSFTSIL
jgi:hypothetical protein